MFDVLFSGTSEVSVDTKGRMSVPAKYRENLSIPSKDDEESNDFQCVVTRSLFDSCLWIYPVAEWEKVVAQLGALPTLTDPLCRTIQRIVLGSAVFCQLDSQGRILLPLELRSLAKLNKKAFLIGFNNKFELWSDEELQAQRLKDEVILRQNMDTMDEHSILANLKL